MRLTRTKKSECPFELRGVFKKGCGKEEGTWSLVVIHPFHNHELPTSLIGHTLAGHLTYEQNGMVTSMSASGIKPKDVLKFILDTNPDSLVPTTHINNAKANHRRKNRGKLTVTQYTLSYLRELEYYVDAERVARSGVLRDLFKSLPSSKHLLDLFLYVVILDSTYKSNKYGYPLLEIVGSTCTEHTFCIAIVFMRHERCENYEWALRNLRHLFAQNLLTAIVSDRELGLLKAAKIVFSKVKHLLCRVHVHRNVEVYITDKLKSEEPREYFTWRVQRLSRSPTEDIYENRLDRLRKKWGKLMQYVEVVWLKYYKENLVSTWSNSVLHFATRLTNRVESQHSILKDMIRNSVGGLDTIVEHMESMWRIQTYNIKEKMEQSRDKISTEIVQGKEWVKCLFKWLVCKVSSECIRLLYDQALLVWEGKFDKGESHDPLWRNSLGLPCSHRIKKYMDRSMPIKPSEVHSFWKQLKWEKWVLKISRLKMTHSSWVHI